MNSTNTKVTFGLACSSLLKTQLFTHLQDISFPFDQMHFSLHKIRTFLGEEIVCGRIHVALSTQLLNSCQEPEKRIFLKENV